MRRRAGARPRVVGDPSRYRDRGPGGTKAATAEAFRRLSADEPPGQLPTLPALPQLGQRGMLAIQSLRLPPPFRGLGSVLPYRSRDVGSTDFDE